MSFNSVELTDEKSVMEVINPKFVRSDERIEQASKISKAVELEHIVANAGVAVELVGKIARAYGTTVYVTGITAKIGQRCKITNPGEQRVLLADVVGISDSLIILFLLGAPDGVSNRSEVRVLNEGKSMAFTESLMGCIVDGCGKSMYQPHELVDSVDVPIVRDAPNALSRAPIQRIFSTGVKAIDTLLTVGEGQRIGIFAAAGGGKSTLLAMLARHSSADVIVIGLIGERGREVREYIEESLGEEGLKRAVIVVSTSDRPAMERVNAAQCATTIAEGFRARGKRVLLLMDSVTRYARALREVGLSIGETPVRRGFPPSVFAELPKLLERTGNNETGSITAFYTVLSEDEQTADPIGEEVRSILDGHIVLSRELGEQGHYPAIDVLASTSRLFLKLSSPVHQQAATRVRQLLAKYRDIELLIQLGEFQMGADAIADDAVNCKAAIETMLRQAPDNSTSFDKSLDMLMRI